jgi:hypothetical protein
MKKALLGILIIACCNVLLASNPISGYTKLQQALTAGIPVSVITNTTNMIKVHSLSTGNKIFGLKSDHFTLDADKNTIYMTSNGYHLNEDGTMRKMLVRYIFSNESSVTVKIYGLASTSNSTLTLQNTLTGTFDDVSLFIPQSESI